MKEKIISTNLTADGTLEIFLGSQILCTISDGTNISEDIIEDILYGLGYQWNDDGTVKKLNKEE